MSLLRGDKSLPICGHHLVLSVHSLTLEARRPTGELDENGKAQFEKNPFEWKIKQPDENASPAEKARWQLVSSWVRCQNLNEVAPGVYEGLCTVALPRVGDVCPVVEGMEISFITNIGFSAEDKSVWEAE